jgi:hypothetical protein
MYLSYPKHGVHHSLYKLGATFHPTQVGGWKKQALAGLPDILGNCREQMRQQSDADKDELYKQIGQLKVDWTFSKKELASTTFELRNLASNSRSSFEIGALSRCCFLAEVKSFTYRGQPSA